MQQRTTDQLRRNRLPWHEQPVKERHPLPVELRQRQLVGIVHQIDQSERRGPVVAVGNSGMDQQHIAGPDLRGAFPDQMLALSGQNQYNLHEGVPVKTPRRMRPHRHLLDVERYRHDAAGNVRDRLSESLPFPVPLYCFLHILLPPS